MTLRIIPTWIDDAIEARIEDARQKAGLYFRPWADAKSHIYRWCLEYVDDYGEVPEFTLEPK